ncbi:MAG: cyclic nucleotide-binding domain-containing protein, partial [Myxococcales bacterium]
EEPFDESVLSTELLGLRGGELCDRAFEVLMSDDDGAAAKADARPPLPLFADLEEEAFVDLVERMALRELRTGEAVVRQGDPGESIFVLVAGRAKVVREGAAQGTLASLSGGALFGELAVLTGAPRTASVYADGELELFEISRDDLNMVAKRHPTVPRALAQFAQRRLAMNLLATAPLFKELPGAQRAEVLNRFAPRVVAPGERVIRQGELAPGLFLVLTGELAVVKTEEQSDIALGLLRDGDVFGEISLVTGNPATATVTATHKTALATLPRASFEELVQSYPQVEDFLVGLSQSRLAMITEAMRPAEVIDAEDLIEQP